MRAPGGRRPKPAGEDATAGLTGGGPSQLGVNGSMRARDVSRPREADLETAQRLVQVSYRPPQTRSSSPRADIPKSAPPEQAEAQEPGSGGSSPDSS